MSVALARVEDTFDFRDPDYAAVLTARMQRLALIRERPEMVPQLKAFYAENPADFITDWGCTFDPRLVARGLPGLVPFILFPKQREFIEWLYGLWKSNGKALGEKSRDAGLSWLCIAFGCWACLFHRDVSIGYGSNLERNVDDSEDPDSLFWKARSFMENLPAEFSNNWSPKRDTKYMKIAFRATNSTMTGSSGDDIGRGGRKTMFFVDEAAALKRPLLVDAALSQTTNCRVDISTPRGMGNPFAQKRFSGNFDVFTIHWRDDPRKDDAWYEKQKRELDPVILAQEVDLSYTASVEGVLIPSSWVQAAIDAHKKLGIAPTGARTGSLDVADRGKDLNAFCGAYGPLVEMVEEWAGGERGIYETVQRAHRLCDEHDYERYKYDADGLGAGVRGDAIVINAERKKCGQRIIEVISFRGSGEKFNPEGEDVKGRKNKDYFLNFKAQSWWALRQRFYKTYRAVTEGAMFPAEDLIFLSSAMPNLAKLTAELSQPTWDHNTVGKMFVDKAPDDTRSPNLADAVMMQFSTTRRAPMRISPEAMKAA